MSQGPGTQPAPLENVNYETHPFATQVHDVFIDGALLPIVPHREEAAARRYAADLSNRRRCEVTVFYAKILTPVGIYEDGVDRFGAVADSGPGWCGKPWQLP